MKTSIEKNIVGFALFAAALFSLGLALPTIHNNINDPNLIVYFNHDEGMQMDLAWYYYSGVKRPSLQFEADYGLELFYLAALARMALSRFINFEPVTLILILRWIHLIAWILSFIMLARLVTRHFNAKWMAAVAVGLLAVRPGFASLCDNTKPEPLILLLTLAGMDYAMRLIEPEKRRRSLLFAIFFSVAAFLVKYAGIFLL